MKAGGAYSRFVAWAKVVLPLVALGLLATLFLIARRIDPEAAIPFAEVDVEQYAREARIGAPEFSGVTADGTVISLSADLARPDPELPSRMMADALSAQLEIPDGSTVSLAAATGTVDAAARSVTLGGGVEIETSTGYRIETSDLTADLAETGLEAPNPIVATGPPGRIEAGALALVRDPDRGDDYLLVFSDGVKLVYRPGD